uniref:NADH dehydrogenase subunit 6 n=1 Tax=Orseolia oryzae TaxID=33408 RepID=A0A0K0M786_9DIPT|nr:NADH dehydrogenase subunit 6 [Orseolia oryzae]
MYIVNIMFMSLNNPLMMGIMLFFQSLLMMLLLGKLYYNFWFSYILFLVMIGGLFILFLYMISLIYNNKFFSLNFLKYIFMFMMLIIISISLFLKKNNIFFKNSEMEMINIMKENYMNHLKFYNFPNNLINLIMIIFLFIMMIIVTKITNYF